MEAMRIKDKVSGLLPIMYCHGYKKGGILEKTARVKGFFQFNVSLTLLNKCR
jgi:hypothetical protein